MPADDKQRLEQLVLQLKLSAVAGRPSPSENSLLNCTSKRQIFQVEMHLLQDAPCCQTHRLVLRWKVWHIATKFLSRCPNASSPPLGAPPLPFIVCDL